MQFTDEQAKEILNLSASLYRLIEIFEEKSDNTREVVSRTEPDEDTGPKAVDAHEALHDWTCEAEDLVDNLRVALDGVEGIGGPREASC